MKVAFLYMFGQLFLFQEFVNEFRSHNAFYESIRAGFRRFYHFDGF